MGIRTVVFVDEIHRFNKAQQDAFLPYVEKGSIILIGATTENPSFEINAALLSRCRVFVLQALSTEDLTELLHHALKSPKGFGYLNVEISEDLIHAIAGFANGDARTALNVLEMAVTNGTISAEKTTVTKEILEQCISKKSLLYDKNGEEHYNLISALHKSMRNSDPDAAVYWLARMLEAGGGSALYRETPDPLRFRGCGTSRQQCPSVSRVRLSGVPLPGNAGMQHPPDPGGRLSLPGAPLQLGLYGL